MTKHQERVKQLTTRERWTIGTCGTLILVGSSLLYVEPPDRFSAEQNFKGQSKAAKTEADPSTVVIAGLTAGCVLLAFAVNGIRFVKFSTGTINLDGSVDNEPESAKGGEQNLEKIPPAGAMQQAGFIGEYFESFFRLSSWNGKKVLLACALASRENKRLPIRTLCAADERMSFDYAFGYLIAASSGGYFTVQSDPAIHLLEIKGFSEINFGYLIKHIQGHLSIPEHDRANKLGELKIITDTLGVPPMNFS